MPVLSMFYGIIIRMFYYDNKQHNLPHIHIEYGEYMAVVSINDGNLLEGNFPKEKLKLVQAWVEIHKDELKANWQLAIEGQNIFKIDALK